MSQVVCAAGGSGSVTVAIGAQALNAGRSAVLAAGWPEAIPATTIDLQCASSQQGAHFAADGRPLGASGGRILAAMVTELGRTEGRYGLQTMCEGGGMANATAATTIERLA